MSLFWETSYTVSPGAGFSLYGAGHCLWLAVWLILCAVSARYTRHNRCRNAVCRRVIALLLLIDELFKYAVTVPRGTFRPDFLPLHLCSINLFVILVDAALEARSPNSKALPYLREILFAVCLPGAAAALLFPGWGELPIANALCIHSFSAHILLFLYPYLLLCEGFQPNFRRFLRVLPWLLLLLPPIARLNRRWGTNFLFLRTAGPNNPLTLFERALGNPGYLWGLALLCALTWGALYAAHPRIARLRK